MKLNLAKSFTIVSTFMFMFNVSGQDLAHHKWKNRVLIIQTSDASSEEYKDQVLEFKGLEHKFKERRLVIYQIVNDSYLLLDFQKKDESKNWKPLKSLNTKIGTKKPFKVVLIGLDGGRKLKQTTVLKKEDLFAIIDAMPMRRSELSDY